MPAETIAKDLDTDDGPATLSASTVLVVDDEPNLRRVLSALLSREGYNVVVADGGRDAIKKAKQLPRLDLLVTDYLMPDMNGLEVLEAVRKYHAGARTLFISGHGTVRSAVEAMRLGAFDFITKPFDVEQVRETARRAIAAGPAGPSLPAEPAAPPVKVAAPPTPNNGGAGSTGVALGRSPSGTPIIGGGGGQTAGKATAKDNTASDGGAPVVLPAGFPMIGDAPATVRTQRRLLSAAASKATVLLLGESGTGKEVAARLVHEASPRRKGPFIAVSCAALPETLLESELFGHEKSAFTGALAAKPGRFELADGGTLFLDEIGDIPHITQVKLLRALQEREVCRIGGVKSVRVDVRVVAATNRDLWQAVQEGSFRLDLYYRLHVIPVTLPPLRERRADIAKLVNFFLERSAKENGRNFPGGFSEETLTVLTNHVWPGNVRELQNAVEYAVVMSAPDAERIERDALPDHLLTPPPAATTASPRPAGEGIAVLK